jgi:hypothetical protein
MVNPLKVALYELYLTLRDRIAPAQDLSSPSGEFIKGINLGGKAVVVAGDRWQSYAEAMATGLSVPGAIALTTYCVPSPYASGGIRTMLNSVIFKPQTLVLEQTLPTASYDVYLWIMENFQAHWRSLEVQVDGQAVAQGIGYLPFQGWARYGPYPVTVNDGRLTLSVTSQAPKIDAHLMGMSLYRQS